MNKEHFSIVPTNFTNFKHMTVSPLYAEEWHVRPPSYDIYTNVPVETDKKINNIEDPRDYPYGQYLCNTNILPSQDKHISLYCNGKACALGYINSNFAQHDIAYRENMTRILKLKMKRRFRHNTYDTFSPFNSF